MPVAAWDDESEPPNKSEIQPSPDWYVLVVNTTLGGLPSSLSIVFSPLSASDERYIQTLIANELSSEKGRMA